MQHQQPGKHSVHENCNHKQVLGIWRGKQVIWGGKGIFRCRKREFIGTHKRRLRLIGKNAKTNDVGHKLDK